MPKKKEKITNEKLARMMARGFKNVHQKIDDKVNGLDNKFTKKFDGLNQKVKDLKYSHDHLKMKVEDIDYKLDKTLTKHDSCDIMRTDHEKRIRILEKAHK